MCKKHEVYGTGTPKVPITLIILIIMLVAPQFGRGLVSETLGESSVRPSCDGHNTPCTCMLF